MKVLMVSLKTEQNIFANKKFSLFLRKKKIIDLFSSMKIYFALNISVKTFLFLQIRLRRLRKLGVSSATEKSDESGNQKTSSNEASNNNNGMLVDTLTSPPSATNQDGNKNVILSGMEHFMSA